MHSSHENATIVQRCASARGTLWRMMGGLLCMLVAAPVRAQAPVDAGPPAEELPVVSGDALVPAPATPEPVDAAAVAAPETPEVVDAAPPASADEIAPAQAPRRAEPHASSPAASADPARALGAPSSTVRPTLATPPARIEPAPEVAPVRSRGWRFPRETVRRPLTLPQGVLRFDSTVSLSAFGSNAFMVGYAGLAAGIFDDVEIGAVPLGLTFIPIGLRFSDPYVYGRVRVLSGDVQIAFRAGTTLPVAGQLPAAQMDLGGEVAWRVLPFFRIDTGLDYGALFASTFNQRIGIPLTATLQAGVQAIALVSGVYVFNDFDDIDVPLMLRYVVSMRGYQGPIGEFSMQGGFTDLEHADASWTVSTRLTFFAYL